MTVTKPSSVQIFGLKKSQAARAAERFFKERGIAVHYVDLAERPLAAQELRRFCDKFGFSGLVDREGKAAVAAGVNYLKLSDEEWIAKIAATPALLRLPLVRAGKRVSVGHDEMAWREMAAAVQ